MFVWIKIFEVIQRTGVSNVCGNSAVFILYFILWELYVKYEFKRFSFWFWKITESHKYSISQQNYTILCKNIYSIYFTTWGNKILSTYFYPRIMSPENRNVNSLSWFTNDFCSNRWLCDDDNVRAYGHGISKFTKYILKSLKPSFISIIVLGMNKWSMHNKNIDLKKKNYTTEWKDEIKLNKIESNELNTNFECSIIIIQKYFQIKMKYSIQSLNFFLIDVTSFSGNCDYWTIKINFEDRFRLKIVKLIKLRM